MAKIERRVVVIMNTSTTTCRCGHSCTERDYHIAVRRAHGHPVRLVGEWNRYATRKDAEAAIKSLRRRGLNEYV